MNKITVKRNWLLRSDRELENGAGQVSPASPL